MQEPEPGDGRVHQCRNARRRRSREALKLCFDSSLVSQSSWRIIDHRPMRQVVRKCDRLRAWIGRRRGRRKGAGGQGVGESAQVAQNDAEVTHRGRAEIIGNVAPRRKFARQMPPKFHSAGRRRRAWRRVFRRPGARCAEILDRADQGRAALGVHHHQRGVSREPVSVAGVTGCTPCFGICSYDQGLFPCAPPPAAIFARFLNNKNGLRISVCGPCGQAVSFSLRRAAAGLPVTQPCICSYNALPSGSRPPGPQPVFRTSNHDPTDDCRGRIATAAGAGAARRIALPLPDNRTNPRKRRKTMTWRNRGACSGGGSLVGSWMRGRIDRPGGGSSASTTARTRDRRGQSLAAGPAEPAPCHPRPRALYRSPAAAIERNRGRTAGANLGGGTWQR